MTEGSDSSFDVLFELGRGGMGSAELALSRGMGGFERLVVIKRLKPEYARDERAVTRFVTEARIAASIHHANVVATHDVSVDADGPFLVIDYVEGATLEGLVDRSMLRGGPLPLPIGLRIALDVLSGLTAVHDARDSRGRLLDVLHRDVSPQNVLVGRDGVARLLDFGVAKSAFGAVFTAEGYIVGKLPYMPPEYLRHESVGPAMDIYALGVTLWSALAGRDHPWHGADEARLAYAIVADGVPPLSRVLQVPPAVEQLIARACAKDASSRFDSARAMADELERLDRETGWMASHRRVAEWLDELVGRDLERRREFVAEKLAERGVRVLDQKTGEVAPANVPRSRGKRLWLWAALAGAAAIALVAALSAPREPTERPSAAASTASLAPPAPAAPPDPVPAPAPCALPAPVEPPRVLRSPPPPKQSAGSRLPPQAPDDIVDKNPYSRPKR